MNTPTTERLRELREGIALQQTDHAKMGMMEWSGGTGMKLYELLALIDAELARREAVPVAWQWRCHDSDDDGQELETWCSWSKCSFLQYKAIKTDSAWHGCESREIYTTVLGEPR